MSRPPGVSRAAVVANPVKFGKLQDFRDSVSAAMAKHGWSEPLWLETTPEDPGEGQARTAVQAGVDVVLASGGDGTVTACAAGLAGSGVPLAIIPAGTGNLLARNLGLPVDVPAALTVALTGTDRQLDVGMANGKLFVALAGLGLDAHMVGGASEPVKKRFGWAAYVVSALAHIRDRPIRVRLQADGADPLLLQASGVIVGNIGMLQGGLPLLPDARPDDGRLDLVVLTARGALSWLVLAAQVVTRRKAATGRIFRSTFRELRVDIDHECPWEIDGEVMGSTRRLVVTVEDWKLTLRVAPAG